MQRNCDACGKAYIAKRSTSKYCSSSCRTRVSQGTVKPKAARPAPTRIDGGVERTTRAALEAADRLETPLGQTCLVLAQRLDSPGSDTGSAISSLAARLEQMLAAATKGNATSAPQQLRDELASRRVKHGA